MKYNLYQLFEEFIFEAEFVNKARPETLRGYVHTFNLLMKLMPNLSIEILNTKTIIDFFHILQVRKRIVGKGKVREGIKKSTVATYWSKLNSFFEWLRIKGHITINPVSGMKCPTPVYEDRKFLKKEDVEKIIAAIHNTPSSNLLLLKRNLVLIYVLLFCGLRREELLFLQLRDIDFERKTLTVRAETSKIPRTRHLPLHSQVIMHLKDYLQERRKFITPYLIVSSSRDDRLSYDGLKHLVNKLKERSGINFHLHQFRHTFAVNFLKSSNNIAKLKQLMGHKDISMTMVYLRCLPTSEMRADIENMNIDSLI
jgi:integrase